MKKNAIVSVFDKIGFEKFRKLQEHGWNILSTGGTASALQKLDIPCTLIESITEFPEMMDGRLKTLHPNVFGGILAKRDNPKHMEALKKYGMLEIDLVVINLYPFMTSPSIENIDVGGPSMLRAAAKNHEFVTAVCDPTDYDEVIDQFATTGQTSLTLRRALAIKAFRLTSEFDDCVLNFLTDRQLNEA
ncbi:MAG: hypothetical protein M3Q80_02020 [bacterium]|nr:hypothetical protein [bacterium]